MRILTGAGAAPLAAGAAVAAGPSAGAAAALADGAPAELAAGAAGGALWQASPARVRRKRVTMPSRRAEFIMPASPNTSLAAAPPAARGRVTAGAAACTDPA